MVNNLMVGAIGFEYTRSQPFQSLAGLGWQPKDRNGSQWNNYWTWIGHLKICGDGALFRARRDYIRTDLRIMRPFADSENKGNKALPSADSGKVLQNPHHPRNKGNEERENKSLASEQVSRADIYRTVPKRHPRKSE
jgi:hypothetical protein